MERCDVLVVGGGPGGSSCAWSLARSGFDVIVADKKSFPRDKVCAGWVTPQVFEALQLDPQTYAKDHVLQPIYGFRVSSTIGPSADVEYNAPISFGVRRCEFDTYLLRRSGARLALGAPIRGLRRSAHGWIANDAIEARIVVGAGGHFCPVAQRFRAENGSRRSLVVAQELEFRLADADAERCRVVPEVPELYFSADLAGYGWLVRKGEWLNVGLGRQDVWALSDHVLEFVDATREARQIPALPSPNLRGHAYRLHGADECLGRDGVLLIGDAAGLAYPRSGEGIRPAVESGLLAARSIAQAGTRDPRDVHDAYQEAIRMRFGVARGPAWLDPLAVLPDSWKRSAAAAALGNRAFARHVVIDRWFLHRREDALAA